MATRPTFKFDFGVGSLQPLPGYVKATRAYDAATGYGWEKPPTRSEDQGGFLLDRDFVAGNDFTFRVDLPDGAYDLTITSADAKSDHWSQEFSANGTVLYTGGLDTKHPFSGTFWAMVAGGTLRFRTRYTLNAAADAALNALTIVPTDKPKPVPPTPHEAAVKAWGSNMVAKGKDVAATLLAAPVDPVKFPDNMMLTFYDTARVFYQVADDTGDHSWDAAAVQSVKLYRGYVEKSGGGVQGYIHFSRGLREHFERTGDVASKAAVLMLADHGAFTLPSVPLSYTAGIDASREVAYAIESMLDAEALDGKRRDKLAPMAGQALGHIDQWLAHAPGNYVRPFMVGLTCDALIQFQGKTKDTRVLPAVRRILDDIWSRCWIAGSRCFMYTDVVAADGTGGQDPAPDLNLLIAPAYAWVFLMTGDMAYRDKADAIFEGGVAGTVDWDPKHYAQQYRWSFDYLDWRDGSVKPSVQTYTLSAPAKATAGVAFDVAIVLPPDLKLDKTVNGTLTVARPSAVPAGPMRLLGGERPDTLTPATVTLPGTFRVTCTTPGTRVISSTNDGGLADPPPVTVTVEAAPAPPPPPPPPPVTSITWESLEAGDATVGEARKFRASLGPGTLGPGVSVLVTPQVVGQSKPASALLTDAAREATFKVTPGPVVSVGRSVSLAVSGGTIPAPAPITLVVRVK